ncbi:hypothetical protein [Neorhizobium galegae]|uniref:Alpha glucuronidase N-terminal domain-containing protein n=1 Tax=Neorhizobium galegae bv. orientalis str. HAMBI 540 TaxID=1028800 RepID=A0A068T3Q1_NEOGA|nr:hypothetical protein [Neorhizobium galegae]MCQ1853340.1 hypothetical protein [Neorhizobium galegae]CDN52030.1 Hypothetical protein RG540_PA13540 [Neorhizobium galegae bv. orientalis str. HAMBI 540]CDZ53190.1 Hypothetical protein NGAL_HAMBI2427_50250 [Neorhizobium galegae bv. orientalis]
MTAPTSVTIVLPDADDAAFHPVRWAATELQAALARRNVQAQIASAAQSGTIITVSGAGLPGNPDMAVDLPETPESFVLTRQGDRISAWGSDILGLVFALTELADRVQFASGVDLFEGTYPLLERPSARVRSMSRMFCSEQEDKVWFYDRQQWRDYLSMLAANRFNRFSLALGFGYNYPYHNPWITDVYFYFPYPYLLDLPGHDVTVVELPEDERERNLEMLKFIGREAARRGLEFQLALWTQRYDFDDVPRANYTVRGVTKDNLAPYCREAITTLLKEIPEITGLTFRVHVEGGIAEGEYGFWEDAFAGVAAAGRPVEIDMHGKGLDHKMIGIARDSGMPIAASPKYLAEHMGPPYHQSAIREKEYPPEVARSEREQLSEGSRKFLRYSYGDLLTADKDYKVIYRIWPGTQRVLLWGDPEFAAGYGRSSMFAGSDGVEWCEPLGFKGRMGTGIPGGRFNYQKQGYATRYDWQKYDYQYRVWGRLLYNPAAPRESWMRYLQQVCGDAAEECEKGMSWASRVLPLVTLAHGPSASNNHYWPEVYTNLALVEGSGRRAYGFDMEGPVRFGNAPTFDPTLFANAREYAELLLAGEPSHRFTPLDVADWLDEMANGCESEVLKANSASSFGSIAVQRMLIDIRICAGLARFFAERFRAACWAELFVATKVTPLMDRVIDHARRSLMAWEKIADISRDLYADDLTYGPQSWLRGSWHSRLPEMQAEVADLESLRGGGCYESVEASPKAAAAIAALEARFPVLSHPSGVTGAPTFKPGADFEVLFDGKAEGEPTLHYRHINQAERWKSLPMKDQAGGFAATVPGSYTQSRYHLQYFVSFRQNGRSCLSPGLQPNLSNEPYFTSLQN